VPRIIQNSEGSVNYISVVSVLIVNYVLVITETTETEIPEKTPASKEYEEGVLEAPRFIQTLQQHIDVIESKPVTLECAVVGE
jgi:hypothetical protein